MIKEENKKRKKKQRKKKQFFNCDMVGGVKKKLNRFFPEDRGIQKKF